MPNEKLEKLKYEKRVCAGELEENFVLCESVRAPTVRSQFL